MSDALGWSRVDLLKLDIKGILPCKALCGWHREALDPRPSQGRKSYVTGGKLRRLVAGDAMKAGVETLSAAGWHGQASASAATGRGGRGGTGAGSPSEPQTLSMMLAGASRQQLLAMVRANKQEAEEERAQYLEELRQAREQADEQASRTRERKAKE